MASRTRARACAVIRQSTVTMARTLARKVPATSFTSFRSSAVSSGPGARQEVEDDELLVGELLADVPRLLVGERPAEVEQTPGRAAPICFERTLYPSMSDSKRARRATRVSSTEMR